MSAAREHRTAAPWLGRLTAAALVFALAGSSASARAQDGDGVYRRLDTDATLSLGVGGGLVLPRDARAEGRAAAALVEARLRIVDAAGPVVAYRWSGDVGGYLALGVELRPLWPMLWLLDKPTGVEWLDLLVQSLGLELAAVVLPLGQPAELDIDRGVALSVGVALEIPLVVPTRLRGANRGVFLRLAARWVDARPAMRTTPTGRDLSEWSLNATFQATWGLHIGADAEPPRYRPRR